MKDNMHEGMLLDEKKSIMLKEKYRLIKKYNTCLLYTSLNPFWYEVLYNDLQNKIKEMV